MKILIIDDGMEKVDLFRNVCSELSSGELEFIHRTNIREGAAVLSEMRMDLLVLDVLIPFEPGGPASPDNSIAFVKELARNTRLIYPSEILALTHHKEDVLESIKELSKLGVLTVGISQNEDWKEVIERYLQSVRMRVKRCLPESSYVRPIVDFVILTALLRPEYSELMKCFSSVEKFHDNELTLARVTIESGSRTLTGIIGCSGGPGVCRMAFAARVICEKFDARLLCLVGIMGGNSDHVALGDVVICDETWDINAGKWREYSDGTVSFLPDMHVHGCTVNPAKIEQFFLENPKELYAAWTLKEGQPRPKSIPSIVRGPVACSSSVIASKDKLREIELNKRKVIGVEMESFGLYGVARFSYQAPRVVTIKAVSDLCDKEKSDDFQSYCAWLSAYVAVLLISKSVL